MSGSSVRHCGLCCRKMGKFFERDRLRTCRRCEVRACATCSQRCSVCRRDTPMGTDTTHCLSCAWLCRMDDLIGRQPISSTIRDCEEWSGQCRPEDTLWRPADGSPGHVWCPLLPARLADIIALCSDVCRIVSEYAAARTTCAGGVGNVVNLSSCSWCGGDLRGDLNTYFGHRLRTCEWLAASPRAWRQVPESGPSPRWECRLCFAMMDGICHARNVSQSLDRLRGHLIRERNSEKT